ncbi:MAG: hypothetical protein ACRC7O_07070, partial [Fimbriiglobus sp.]
QLLDQQVKIREQLELRSAAEDEFLKQRKQQLTARVAELDAARKQVANGLDAQTTVESNLFDVQKSTGETMRANFALEDVLAAAELKPRR